MKLIKARSQRARLCEQHPAILTLRESVDLWKGLPRHDQYFVPVTSGTKLRLAACGAVCVPGWLIRLVTRLQSHTYNSVAYVQP